MDQVTAMKVQFHLEQWRQLIRDQQSSGMTIRSWCEQNGYKEHTFYYYLKKLRQEGLKCLPASSLDETKSISFKKLEVQTPVTATTAAVIIRLPNATVEITEGTSQQTIQAVLLALQTVC